MQRAVTYTPTPTASSPLLAPLAKWFLPFGRIRLRTGSYAKARGPQTAAGTAIVATATAAPAEARTAAPRVKPVRAATNPTFATGEQPGHVWHQSRDKPLPGARWTLRQVTTGAALDHEKSCPHLHFMWSHPPSLAIMALHAGQYLRCSSRAARRKARSARRAWRRCSWVGPSCASPSASSAASGGNSMPREVSSTLASCCRHTGHHGLRGRQNSVCLLRQGWHNECPQASRGSSTSSRQMAHSTRWAGSSLLAVTYADVAGESLGENPLCCISRSKPCSTLGRLGSEIDLCSVAGEKPPSRRSTTASVVRKRFST
mmetsp:Transcript_9097/g.23581  ORF Transcript_9097/g.23581 Transcript_9097/m.23581 type:complete len:316 (-) Transcript_9097:79-1026(-)